MKEDPAKFFEIHRGKSDSPGVTPKVGNYWENPDVDRPRQYNWVKDGGRVGLNRGGLAPLLGEPTFQDEEHRVPYQDGEFVKKENLPSGLKAEVGDPTPGWGLSDLVRRYFLYQKVLPGVGEETQKYLGEKFLNDLNAQGYSPKDFKAYIDEQFSESKADGGRIGFGKGKLVDAGRRWFLEMMGGAAAGVGAAKSGLFGLLKGSKSAVVKDLTSVPIQNAEGMPPWFKGLVNRVIKEGEDITKLPPNKGGAWKEREIVHSAKLGENQGVKVSQDLDNQTITVEYQSVDNMGGIDDAVRLEYKAAEEIPMDNEVFKNLPKGKSSVKTKPTFEAEEAWPHGTTGDYKDITMEGTNTVTKVDDLYSDTSALKQFGTGKDLSKKELAIAKQKQKRVNEINNDLGEQSQLLPDPPDYDDFAQGGRVPLGKGKLAKYATPEGLAKLIEKLFPGTTKIGQTSRPMAEKKQLRKAIAEFQEREKAAKDISEGPLPGERAGIDVPHMPSGFKLSREKLEQNFQELSLDQIDEIMNLDREMQGTVITKLKNRRLDPDLYDELL